MARQRPEILAPAGSKEALKAAIAAGADAVYFGLERFNARERAVNFTLAELPEIMALLHLRGVKGYVAFNTLVYESELKDAEKIIRAMVDADVDALIVQDLGIAKMAHALAPDLALHASTQMTITDAASAEVARSLGLTRAILARELSTTEIGLLAEKTSIELEVFVHGALCVSYSGQCFTSASWGGRSANRGECAQACRMPYDLLVDDEIRELGDVKYLLSPLDLMGVAALPALVQAGVVSFKIEGRLKGPEYVAATTRLYRQALERYLQGQSAPLLTVAENRELSQVYSRGPSSGFLAGTNHQSILEGLYPGHRGNFIGLVTGRDERKQHILAELAVELKTGDGILFTAPTLDPENKKGPGGRITALYDPLGKKCEYLSGKASLEFEKMRLDVRDVPVGAKVFRTHDPVLESRLNEIIAKDVGKPIPLTMRITGAKGKPLRLEISDTNGNRISAVSDTLLTSANKSSLDETILREKLGRLGETPYLLDELAINLERNLYLSPSDLNQMRREAIEKLSAMRLKPRNRALSSAFVSTELMSAPITSEVEKAPYIVPLCRTAEQLEGALAAGSKEVILDFMELVGLKAAVEKAKAAGLRVAVAPPRITKPGEEKILDNFLKLNPDEILVRSLGQLEYLSQETSVFLRGDFSLNVANAITARLLIERGLKTVVPSYDLSMKELELFYGDFPATLSELVIHQHLPMFHMEYCAYAKLISPKLGFKGTSYADCGRPCEMHRIALKDHTGASHPIVVDVGCRNTVFSSEANSVAEDVLHFVEKGVSRLRVELLNEDTVETKNLIQSYQDLLSGKCSGLEVRIQSGAIRRLGVLRVDG